MNIQMFIRGWLVYEITASYEKLGWMTAAGGLVGLFAAPLGGVVADRVRQKKVVLQISGVANALITFWIAALIYRGELVFGHLLVSSILQGLVMNAMMPARQAFTKDIVGLNRLTNAIGLSTSGMNTARLLLPGLAGGLVAALGGGNGNIDPAQWIYLLMAGLYLWSAALMSFIQVNDKADADMPTGSMLVELRLGFRYVLDTPVIFMLLGCNFLMVFFSLTYFMLLPGFAKDVLAAGPGSAWVINLDLGYRNRSSARSISRRSEIGVGLGFSYGGAGIMGISFAALRHIKHIFWIFGRLAHHRRLLVKATPHVAQQCAHPILC